MAGSPLNKQGSSNSSPGLPCQAELQGRLVSLDVLRGLTVAFMILVNNAGDGAASYAQLRHSAWNGCTLADLVFPLFLFIVGASISLAFGARLKRGISRHAILLPVARRSLCIFALGLILNALPFFHLSELRYYGVLQRIALCYALASALYLAGRLAACAAACTAALAAYWWLLLHVPVPGIGLPGVTVGILDPYGNLAAWLDRLLVPQAHLYHHSFYDPEGLLSTLPALATTLFGVLAMRWLLTARPVWKKCFLAFVAGIFLIACGLLWAQSFPLNKRLWTSSFVLFTAGISIAIFALLFWLIDGPFRLRRSLAPWLAFGANALSAYVLSELLAIALGAIQLPSHESLQQFLFHLLPRCLAPLPMVSMLYSALFVLVCYLPVLFLYRRKIFIKL
jgi:predicted acyltransferase